MVVQPCEYMKNTVHSEQINSFISIKEVCISLTLSNWYKEKPFDLLKGMDL